jgi:hypothetical protein
VIYVTSLLYNTHLVLPPTVGNLAWPCRHGNHGLVEWKVVSKAIKREGTSTNMVVVAWEVALNTHLNAADDG